MSLAVKIFLYIWHPNKFHNYGVIDLQHGAL